MIIRGRGAYVDSEERKLHGLSAGELSVLKIIFKDPTRKRTSAGWANKLTLPEHRISGFLSYLKGMDLIKSSSDDYLLTDNEKELCKEVEGSAVYWIGDIGTPIYKRAQYALDNNGKLTDILKSKMQFDFALFPERIEKSITISAKMKYIDGDEIGFVIPDLTGHQHLKFLELKEQKEVMITVESM